MGLNSLAMGSQPGPRQQGTPAGVMAAGRSEWRATTARDVGGGGSVARDASEPRCQRVSAARAPTGSCGASS